VQFCWQGKKTAIRISTTFAVFFVQKGKNNIYLLNVFIKIKMAPTSTKKGRISQSSRAGIIFPVARIHRYLKSSPLSTARVTKGASVYLAAVAEYLVGRLIKYFIIK